MTCPSCQADVGAADIFCAFCGKRLPAPEQRASIPEASTGTHFAVSRWPRVLVMGIIQLLLFGGAAWGAYSWMAHRSSQSSASPPAPDSAAGAKAALAPSTPAHPISQPASPSASPPVSEPHAAPSRSKSPHSAQQKKTPAKPGARAVKAASRAKPKSHAGPKAHAAGLSSSDHTATSDHEATARGASSDHEAAAREAKGDGQTAPAPEAEDELDQARMAYNADSVQMVVQHHQPQVGMCYDRAQKQIGPISGMIEVQLTIDDNGKVSKARVRRNTTGHEGLGGCLVALFKRWRFPRPVGGAATLVYPFLFSTSGGQ